MKKKILLIFAVFCIIAISQVHSLGLGVQGNFYLHFDKEDEFEYSEESPKTPDLGFSLLVSPSRQLNFAGSYYFNKTTHIISLTGDFCPEAFTFKLFGSGMTLLSNPNAWWLNFGFGVGGFVNLWIVDSDQNKAINDYQVAGGLRLPLGFNMNLANGRFEIFANIAPSVEIRFGEATPFFDFFFPVALGVRVWL